MYHRNTHEPRDRGMTFRQPFSIWGYGISVVNDSFLLSYTISPVSCCFNGIMVIMNSGTIFLCFIIPGSEHGFLLVIAYLVKEADFAVGDFYGYIQCLVVKLFIGKSRGICK